MEWKPKLAQTTDLLALELTNDEGFLVAQLDGATTLHQLGQLTGQSPEQVIALLTRLVGEGAVLPAPEPEQPPPEGAPPPVAEPGPEEDEEPSAADDAATARNDATHLRLYREQFHLLEADARAKLAGVASGATLSALCFDPLPSVIHHLLQNPLAGPEQARLIATHHRNAAGLEFLFTRAELLRDHQVQRLLWRNPQLNEGQLRRLTQAKRLLALWKLTVSREATSQTRAATVKLVRARFPTASAEERVELIFTTEGRALAGLAGLPIDGRTTALLCARTYASVMLVQSLARWAAAPPALIAHLLKQPLVVRQPRLRTLLMLHPNAPARE